MARIRTIKPEFFVDEKVGECSMSARLLFVATWVFADDHGNLERSSKQLKAQAFPYDSIDCEPLIRELIDAGLLVEYESAGKKFLHIKNFRVHQKIDKPSKPRVPLYEESETAQRTLAEYSASPRPGRERKGKEGKGKEGNIHSTRDVRVDHASSTREPDFAKAEREAREQFERVKAAYPRFAGRQDWINAEHACHNRIEQDAQTWDDLVAAAERYAAYCRATGREGTNFVMSPGKFFSAPDRPWLQPWDPPDPPKRNGHGASVSRSKSAEDTENEYIERYIREGLTDAQIAALEDFAATPNLLARVRAIRREIEQHEQP